MYSDHTSPNTKYSITMIIPMTKTIDPITYKSLAGSDGTNLFKTNKIIPIIINAIPVSNDTILFLYILNGLYHLPNNKRKKFRYNLSYNSISIYTHFFSALSTTEYQRSNLDALPIIMGILKFERLGFI